ncbi:hypothetical protein KL936_004549 [Ogataea polymorpha]|nr:hypothetical protein KL936_004549 [Ogataea polymorpha]
MTVENATTIGYIGLGLAGGPMAENIPKKGFKLIVRDANKERENWFLANNTVNTERAGEGRDAFKDVDILITMLPNGHIVRDVLLGENGVAPFLKPACLVVDTSSSDPFGTKQLEDDLSQYKVRLIDSPVTQVRMHGLNDGEACFMLGGQKEDIDYALPVLKTMCRWWFHMGPIGSGHVMKTFNNYTTGAAIAALNDCFMVGAKMGLDPAMITEVLNVGTGRNYGTAHSFRAEALTRTYNSGYGLALLVKDLGINRDLMKKVNVDSRLADLVWDNWNEALQDEDIEKSADYTKALMHWENKAEIKLPTYVDLEEEEEPRAEFTGAPDFKTI